MKISIYLFFYLIFFFVYAANAIEKPQNFAIDIKANITLPESNFTVQRAISRTIGVAPLSIFFTAGYTESSQESRSFHDYEYSWDYGDTTSGTWGTTGVSKNNDKGPTAAHVYEVPGSYTARLTVRNSTGVVDTEAFTITVTDPDSVYSSTNTTCISDVASNDFTGCPSGAAHVATNDISNLTSYAGSNKRILFRRGSTWALTDTPTIPGESGLYLGAYGACINADAQGLCGNAPLITINGTDDDVFINLNSRTDVIIKDLHFSNDSYTQGRSVTSAVANYRRILFHKVKVEGFYMGIETFHYNRYLTDPIADFCIASSNLSEAYSMQVFLGGERVAFIGNIAKNSKTSHILRVWQAYQGVINHNILSGASYTSVTGRHALKLHGPAEGVDHCTPVSGNSCLENRTEFVVVSANVFGGSGPWPVTIEPQDSIHDERISDVIFEKNKVISQFGTQSATPVQVGIMLSGRYISIRNNILDGTGSAPFYTGINITRRGIEWLPLGNMLYNNTIYKGDSADDAVGLLVEAETSSAYLKNNLVSFPAGIDILLVKDNSGKAVHSNNVFTDTSAFSNPDDMNPLFRDFTLTESSSEAIDHGILIPLFDDFFGKQRLNTMDIGAHSY